MPDSYGSANPSHCGYVTIQPFLNLPLHFRLKVVQQNRGYRTNFGGGVGTVAFCSGAQ